MQTITARDAEALRDYLQTPEAATGTKIVLPDSDLELGIEPAEPEDAIRMPDGTERSPIVFPADWLPRAGMTLVFAAVETVANTQQRPVLLTRVANVADRAHLIVSRGYTVDARDPSVLLLLPDPVAPIDSTITQAELFPLQARATCRAFLSCQHGCLEVTFAGDGEGLTVVPATLGTPLPDLGLSPPSRDDVWNDIEKFAMDAASGPSPPAVAAITTGGSIRVATEPVSALGRYLIRARNYSPAASADDWVTASMATVEENVSGAVTTAAPPCTRCGQLLTDRAGTRRCSRCYEAVYCGDECRRVDLPIHAMSCEEAVFSSSSSSSSSSSMDSESSSDSSSGESAGKEESVGARRRRGGRRSSRRRKGFTSSKARKVLRHGSVRGKRLTPAQRRYFNWLVGCDASP